MLWAHLEGVEVDEDTHEVIGETPLPEGWTCRVERAEGAVPDAIAEAAVGTDLIVMATHGQDSLFDAFVGTNTERVFHAAPCPVLAVPLR